MQHPSPAHKHPENVGTPEKVRPTRQVTCSFPQGKNHPDLQPTPERILAALRCARSATSKRSRAQVPGVPNGDDYVIAGSKTRRAERQPQRALVRDYKRTGGRVTGDGWHRADKHLRIVTFRALNDLQQEYELLNPEEFTDALTDALDTYVHEDLKNVLKDQVAFDVIELTHRAHLQRRELVHEIKIREVSAIQTAHDYMQNSPPPAPLQIRST